MRTFIVYTLFEGGTYHVVRGTWEEYVEAKEAGYLLVDSQHHGAPELIKPKMVAFLGCAEYHDFVLDKTFAPGVVGA